MLACAVSAGTQEEYVVLQIRRGRLYFLFDPQVRVNEETSEKDLYQASQRHLVHLMVSDDEAFAVSIFPIDPG